jgi:hypothetical protein
MKTNNSFLFLGFIGLLLLLNPIQAQEIHPEIGTLIGYKNNSPVFRGYQTTDIFIYRDELVLYEKGNSIYEPVFVQNELTVYRNVKDKKDLNFLLKVESKIDTISLNHYYNTFAFDSENNRLFVATVEEEIYPLLAIDLSSGQVISYDSVPVSYLSGVLHSKLYYTLQDEKEGYPDVDVISMDLNDFSKKEVIVEGVHASRIVLLPNSKKIVFRYAFSNPSGTYMINLKGKHKERWDRDLFDHGYTILDFAQQKRVVRYRSGSGIFKDLSF